MDHCKKRIGKGKAQPKKNATTAFATAAVSSSESNFNIFETPKESKPRARRAAPKKAAANYANGCRFFIGHVRKGVEDQQINPRPKVKDLKEAWKVLPKAVKELIADHALEGKESSTGEEGSPQDTDAVAPKKRERAVHGPRVNAALGGVRRRGHGNYPSHKLNCSVEELIKMSRDKYQFCRCHLEGCEQSNEESKGKQHGVNKCHYEDNESSGDYEEQDYNDDNMDDSVFGGVHGEYEDDEEATMEETRPVAQHKTCKRKAAPANGGENADKPKRRKPYEMSGECSYAVDDEVLGLLQDTVPNNGKGAQKRRVQGDEEANMDAAFEALDENLVPSDEADVGVVGGQSRFKTRKSNNQKTYASDTDTDASDA